MTLTRSTPLRRTPFKRKPLGQREPVLTSTAPRRRKCVVCEEPFKPQRLGQKVCGPTCAQVQGRLDTERQERKALKAAKAAMKTPAQLAEPVRKLAQRYAVLRDRDCGCISCDKPAHWTGGKWHGSHFKSVGSNSALQFNLLNIHKACDQCNYFMAGNIGPYETRLRQKIGDEKVDWLKCHPRSREYTPEYLARLAAILRKKIKRLERRSVC
jgi:predicted nucleic acid-binding Zn ribbon protein